MYYQEQVKALEESEKKLSNIIYGVTRRLKSAPDGTIYVGTSNGCSQFHIGYPGTKTEYIPQSNKVLIRRHAQKVYDRKLLNKAQKIRALLQKFIQILKKNNMDEVFDKLPAPLKPLVQQYELTDEEYAAKWKGPVNEPQNTTAYITKNGEYVRSKSEQLIANLLLDYGIPYKYEHEYELKRPYGKGYITIHPDFTVLNKRTHKEFVIEHLGRLDDPEYQEKLVVKMTTYFINGWFCGKPLLFTCETSDCQLNTKAVEKLIEDFLL